VSTANGPEAIVVMAEVMAPYGVRGWVKIRPFSETPDALLAFARWWLRAAGSAAWREITRIDGRTHSGAVLAQLEGITTREAALALGGAQVGVRRADLPPPGRNEIYRADLVGLGVVNREGIVLGEVVAVEDHGAHPLLRVAAPGAQGSRERLIPFVDAHVDRVDLAARRIEVDWQPDY
jgi:16S rRNA processing protein RimM